MSEDSGFDAEYRRRAARERLWIIDALVVAIDRRSEVYAILDEAAELRRLS